MHCIDDEVNGVVINHNGDWSGEVRIAWYTVGERRNPGPTPPSLRDCWCDGSDLIAGRYTPVNAPGGGASHEDPPVDVLMRAVALAVEAYMHMKMMSAVENIGISRRKR